MKSIHNLIRSILGQNLKTRHLPLPNISTNLAVWSIPELDVLDSLGSRQAGLLVEEIEERQKTFGKNELHSKNEISKAKIFLDQFKSPLIFMLIGAAILAAFLNEWLNTTVIMLAVLVNVILGFFQEYHAEQTIKKLKTYIKDRVRVVRGGVEQEINAIDLVPGDIIKLTYGSRIPADSRIINLNNFSVDESILTGESLPIRKKMDLVGEGTLISERTNMAFAGTLVSEGYATAVVFRTGLKTELGKIASLVASTKKDKTPLQNSLAKFGWVVFYGVILLVSIIFLLGVMRGQPIGEMLILSAAIAVSAIPEALPIALTVILAIGAERLAIKKGVMRSLSAVETLGSANLIMTDKTGTLTEAKMKLIDVVPTPEIVSGRKIISIEDGIKDEKQKEILKLAISNIDVVYVEKAENDESRFLGRPLEVNIAISAHRNNINVVKDKHSILLPFSSSYKFSIGLDFDTNKIVALGAPDILLNRSDIDKDSYLLIKEKIEEFSEDGNRLLGIAYLPDDSKKIINEKPFTESDAKNLEFIGLIVLRDPVRKEVPLAVKNIENSGSKVVIVTGDMKGTAIAVARELGFNIEQKNVISGEELHNMNDEELLANMPDLKIFARVTPEDKLRIGTLYKKLGYIVAMTGDGVNDAPSLKMADIGIAIGSGSDVAKSAADLVLLDDNFETIVLAIEEGRRILSNIRKAFIYLMSSVLDGVILLGGSLVFAMPLPLTALHIIWINFFTGSLPALSFAFDDNYDSYYIRKSKTKNIFNKEVIILTAGIGTLTSVLLFVLYAILLKSNFTFGEVRSLLFACFSLYVVLAAYSFRSLYKPIYKYPIFANKILNRSVLFSTGMCAMTLFVPFMQNIFKLDSMPKEAYIILPVWFILNILVIEITKWFFRLYQGGKK